MAISIKNTGSGGSMRLTGTGGGMKVYKASQPGGGGGGGGGSFPMWRNSNAILANTRTSNVLTDPYYGKSYGITLDSGGASFDVLSATNIGQGNTLGMLNQMCVTRADGSKLFIGSENRASHRPLFYVTDASGNFSTEPALLPIPEGYPAPYSGSGGGSGGMYWAVPRPDGTVVCAGAYASSSSGSSATVIWVINPDNTSFVLRSLDYANVIFNRFPASSAARVSSSGKIVVAGSKNIYEDGSNPNYPNPTHNPSVSRVQAAYTVINTDNTYTDYLLPQEDDFNVQSRASVVVHRATKGDVLITGWITDQNSSTLTAAQMNPVVSWRLSDSDLTTATIIPYRNESNDLLYPSWGGQLSGNHNSNGQKVPYSNSQLSVSDERMTCMPAGTALYQVDNATNAVSEGSLSILGGGGTTRNNYSAPSQAIIRPDGSIVYAYSACRDRPAGVRVITDIDTYTDIPLDLGVDWPTDVYVNGSTYTFTYPYLMNNGDGTIRVVCIKQVVGNSQYVNLQKNIRTVTLLADNTWSSTSDIVLPDYVTVVYVA
jgi:hypothetical protein